MSHAMIRVGVVGNPNCGKTTLFNVYTGANLKVANWPGVTVEKKEGYAECKGYEFKLIDLPGIYSLTSYTMEETVARECIQSGEVDVIVNVADASCLERSLYLTMQLIELEKPLILALNMMDIVEERGIEINLQRLSKMLGIPVIPVSAKKRTGLETLLYTAAHYEEYQSQIPVFQPFFGKPSQIHRRTDHVTTDHTTTDQKKMDHATADQETTDQETEEECEKEWIYQTYDFIEKIMDEILIDRAESEGRTDRLDRCLTDKWLGLPIFLGIMGLIFFLTFAVGDWLKAYFELALEWFLGSASNLLAAWSVSPVLRSLIVDGIISGVGGILTFLPNIFILFLALAFLEDSGYMARAAFVMDDLMSSLGLSGRAFLPLLLGFGCSVPAVMASRMLEHPKDRRKTILITPFMSCSARLPVYVLFSSMFFGKYAILACYSMYLLGILTAVLTVFILSETDGGKAESMLLMELPEYKMPNAGTIAVYVREKVKDYLTKAGTVIFLASIVMWMILNFGPHGYVTDISRSFGSLIGRAAEPLFAPIGLGYWQIIVALIAGIAAKEVVVSSCGVLFRVHNIVSPAGMSSLAAALESIGFGAANAYALMTFCLLYVPCTATVAAIYREVGSVKETAAMILYQLAVAWSVSFLTYHLMGMIL